MNLEQNFGIVNSYNATDKVNLSHGVASGSDIMPCIKIDKPLETSLYSNAM